MTTRWVLTDVATAETWTMPINPREMSSPNQGRALDTVAGGVSNALTGVRIVKRATPPQEFTWGGVIRSKEHYDALKHWAQKTGKVHVTDHLGRTFEVLIEQFDPEDRLPTGQVSWRLTYTMRTFLLRRVS